MHEDAKGPGREEQTLNAAPIAEEPDFSIDVIAMIRTVIRGKITVAFVTAGFGFIAALIAFLLPPQYTSAASFIPPSSSNSNSMAMALAGQLSAMGAGNIIGGVKTAGDLYEGILRSRSVAEEIVGRFNLKSVYRVKKESDAERILGSKTAVLVDIKSSIVEVEVTADSPKLAQDLANAYMDVLRQTNGRLALSQSSQQRLFFGQQLENEKNQLEDAEVELKKTEEYSGLIAPTGQTEVEIQTVAQTRAQIALRQVQLAALRQSSTDENSDVIRLKSEIGNLEGQLARLQNGSGPPSAAAIPTSKVPELQLDYVRKEREVKYHEALFDMLSRQFEAARLDEAHDAPVLQVLDAASYPDTKSSPKRALIIACGLILGFLGSCVWVLVRGPLRAFRSSLQSE